jgi:rare lipoprotein A
MSVLRFCLVLPVMASLSILGACSSAKNLIDSKYGVAASPRVIGKNEPVPRGGGRYQVGKPYKVAGRWYTPKEDPHYNKTGQASWYGDAFHGRLTANGEVYDMNALSAAHPTLPLPSYVRVTNLENNNSVIVRVNDRGPFAHNRIIDLSKRAADTLDFRNQGLAKVRVQYVGKARMDGQDQQWLEASINRPGTPSGLMLANAVQAPVTTPSAKPAPASPALMVSQTMAAPYATPATAQALQLPAGVMAYAPPPAQQQGSKVYDAPIELASFQQDPLATRHMQQGFTAPSYGTQPVNQAAPAQPRSYPQGLVPPAGIAQ